MIKDVRRAVFFPPAAILLLAVFFSFYDYDRFIAAAVALNGVILDTFGWAFSLFPFLAVLLVGAVFVSPLGRVRIGGEAAKPILSRWNWFSITLCTTIATGILFWGSAEPLIHLNAPPNFAGVDARTEEAATFAISTLYFHWAITPYAIYLVPSLAFALAYYNLGSAYSLSGPFSVALGAPVEGRPAALIDALALFALVAGVAASLGTGVMTLSGGLGGIVPDGPVVRLFITAIIVSTYVASSISGLNKGIRILSDINVRIFIALAGFMLLAGPTLATMKIGFAGTIDYLAGFAPRSLILTGGEDSAWIRSWTNFNFANWMAWAPITALFLGRIAVGYRVREFILVSMAAPAAFSIVWMTIFGGVSLLTDLETQGAMTAALEGDGPNAVIYAIFNTLPFAGPVIALFVGATFISFVTAMDSNTHSIASVCLRARRQDDEGPGAQLWIKLFWGVLIGTVAWVMTSTKGIDGVRQLSNLGGAPGLFILIISSIALIRLMTIDRSQIANDD
ncbi:MAG: BCCT family transporter [Pseudomonadota bacterium]